MCCLICKSMYGHVFSLVSTLICDVRSWLWSHRCSLVIYTSLKQHLSTCPVSETGLLVRTSQLSSCLWSLCERCHVFLFCVTLGVFLESFSSEQDFPTSMSNLVMSAFHWKNSWTAPPKSLAASLEEKLCLSPALLHVTRNLRVLALVAALSEFSAAGSVSGDPSVWPSALDSSWGASMGSVLAKVVSLSSWSGGPLLLLLSPFLWAFLFFTALFSFHTSRALVQGSLEASSCSSLSVSSWE